MDFPHESGIYRIRNTKNDKVYIGQSIDVHRRALTHIRDLNNGSHYNDCLQRAWNKYGKDSFEFSILEFCSPEQLNDKEIYYISKYDSVNNGYNLTDGGLGCNGYKQPESVVLATKLRSSKSVTLLNTRESFVSAVEASNKYGANRTSISNCCKGKRRYAGLLNGERMAWVFTEDYRMMSEDEINARLSLAAIKNEGANSTSSKPVVLLNFDEYFDCVTVAAKKYGICVSLLSRCCRNKCLSAGSFNGKKLVWCFYEDYKVMSDSEIEERINYAQVSMVGKNHFAAKQIKLLNTGEVFGSMADASRKYGVLSKGISSCCIGTKKSYGKLNGEKMIWVYC